MNLPATFNAAAWNTDSRGCDVANVIMNTWLRSVASAEDSVPVVVQDAWWKVPPCWSMKYCLNNPYAMNGGLIFAIMRATQCFATYCNQYMTKNRSYGTDPFQKTIHKLFGIDF
jgi:hypothetical protein